MLWNLVGKGVTDSSGNPVDLGPAQTVRLWHPLACDAEEVAAMAQTRSYGAKIRQPFRQAFREFYEVTDGERETRMYSNRFARVLMRQHQFASLCRARGWEYRLMGADFDGANVPTKNSIHGTCVWNFTSTFHPIEMVRFWNRPWGNSPARE